MEHEPKKDKGRFLKYQYASDISFQDINDCFGGELYDYLTLPVDEPLSG